ncbi:hypothetical protein [Pararhodobacter marinus]|uniref:hypothetical protein n=1 Tax=Pararhodobacter marinus TaxID=2184063 RepID=UPI0035180977
MLALVARQIAIRAAVALFGLAFVGAGVVFALRALWLSLVLTYGPMATALIMGGGLLAVGMLVLWLALRRPRVPVPPPAPVAANPLNSVVAAFAQGYGVAQAMKSKHTP